MRDCVPELARPPWGRVGVVARTEVGGCLLKSRLRGIRRHKTPLLRKKRLKRCLLESSSFSPLLLAFVWPENQDFFIYLAVF